MPIQTRFLRHGRVFMDSRDFCQCRNLPNRRRALPGRDPAERAVMREGLPRQDAEAARSVPQEGGPGWGSLRARKPAMRGRGRGPPRVKGGGPRPRAMRAKKSHLQSARAGPAARPGATDLAAKDELAFREEPGRARRP